MSRSFALEKLKPVLMKLGMPVSGELASVLDMEPVMLLRNIMFKPSRYLKMRVDNLENLEDLQVVAGYHVRTYRSGDEDIWVRLVKCSFGQYYAYNVAEICESKDFDPEGFFFLKHNNEFVGTVYARQVRFQGVRIGCVHMLCVIPAYRGKGLGRFLTLYALHYFRKIGLHSAILDVDESNYIAIKTYVSLGFKPI